MRKFYFEYTLSNEKNFIKKQVHSDEIFRVTLKVEHTV